MNKKPVSYLQTDSRWKSLPYRVTGENSTIGGSGCGPTSAAMLIETLTGKTFTPVDACNWSMAHGYKALNQGTYYGYFVPQFKAQGITCKQLLGSRILNQPNHAIHAQVQQYLKEGYYIIALMGPGLWTNGGHFVVVWDWDTKVRINDPASTKEAKLNGDPALFKNQVRNYWLIDAREYNKEEEEVTYDQWKAFMTQYRKELSTAPVADYAKDPIKTCIQAGIMSNTGTPEAPAIDRPGDFLTRQEAATMQARLIEKVGT